MKLLFRQYVSKPIDPLIIRVNSLINGWCNYHRYVNSNSTFRALDNFMYAQAVRWARRSHVNKGWKWICKKYFAQGTALRRTKTGRLSLNVNNWGFRSNSGSNSGRTIKLFRNTPLENYSSISYGRNPFNPADVDYFKNRKLDRLFTKDSFRKLIHDRQLGICPRMCSRYRESGLG